MSDALADNPHAAEALSFIAGFTDPLSDELYGQSIIAQAMLAVAWEIRALREVTEAREDRERDAARPRVPCRICGRGNGGPKCADCQEVLGEGA